ncbi:uncharacterized protein LOC127082091 [Lathyrus oleraceus]|uniref:uncharacterized protein LOC127082091 n=1 Tax=Pisum sativum TaxID=3888 RepID=UPI0021D11ACE|nr:uncharacterized protein LOC127082091 [Pisum sativum]
MPNYSKFMKYVLTKSKRVGEFATIALTQECNRLVQGKLPQKLKDPGSFTVPCIIGDTLRGKTLCGLGASINRMPLSIFKKLGIGAARPTTITLQLADISICYPQGKIEDVLVRVDKFVFPDNFIIMDFNVDEETLILLGRSFLATGGTLIDVERGELTVRVNGHQVVFNILNALQYPEEDVVECSMISSWEGIIHKNLLKSNNVLEQELGKLEKEDVQHDGIISGPLCKSYIPEEPVKVLELSTKLKNQRLPSVEVPPELELKQLPFAICLPRGRTKVSSHCGY